MGHDVPGGEDADAVDGARVLDEDLRRRKEGGGGGRGLGPEGGRERGGGASAWTRTDWTKRFGSQQWLRKRATEPILDASTHISGFSSFCAAAETRVSCEPVLRRLESDFFSPGPRATRGGTC